MWVRGGSGDPAVSNGESEKEERISSTFFSKWLTKSLDRSEEGEGLWEGPRGWRRWKIVF